MFAFLTKFKTDVREFIADAGSKLAGIEAKIEGSASAVASKIEAEFAALEAKVEALFEAKKTPDATGTAPSEDAVSVTPKADETATKE